MSPTEFACFKAETNADRVAISMIRRAWDMKSRLAVAATKEVTDRVEGSATPAHLGGGSKPSIGTVNVFFGPKGAIVDVTPENGNGRE
jgi:hypothetical protein